MTSQESEVLLSQALDRIVKGFDPEKIILFGSRARNTANTDSDLDLCILKNSIIHKRKLAQEIYKALLGTKLPIDIIVETSDRFNALKSNPAFIFKAIDQEGKTLYERA
jgi:predicted nucleotidyltransferase